MGRETFQQPSGFPGPLGLPFTLQSLASFTELDLCPSASPLRAAGLDLSPYPGLLTSGQYVS